MLVFIETCKKYLFGQAKTEGLEQVTLEKNKKSPRGIRPRHCSPFPQGAKYIAVTQETSPSHIVDVCSKYLFGRAKTGVWGK